MGKTQALAEEPLKQEQPATAATGAPHQGASQDGQQASEPTGSKSPVPESVSKEMFAALEAVSVGKEAIDRDRALGISDLGKDKADLNKSEATLEKLVKSNPEDARKDLEGLQEIREMVAQRGDTLNTKDFEKDIANLREAMAKVGVRETEGTGHGVTASTGAAKSNDHGM